jgi:RHS repeat-associated protein
MTYDQRNRLRRTTDHFGNFSTYDYDAGDNLIAETDALGNEVRHFYDVPLGQFAVLPLPVSTTDARGYTSTCAYTTDGALESATGPLGGTVTHTYDALGRRTSTANPLGQRSCIEYDAGGLPVSQFYCTLDPPGDPQGELKPVCVNGTNEGTICVSDGDCAGGVCGLRTTMAYDAQGRLLETTEPDGAISSISYTATGRVKAVTAPLGRSQSFEYDELDRVEATDQPSPADRARLGLPRLKTELSYDLASNGLTGVRVTDVTGTPTFAQVEAEYDKLNRLTVVRDPNCFAQPSTPNCGVTRYEHDAVGRVVRDGEDVDDDGTIEFAVESSFDGRGLLVARRNARGSEIGYSYDDAGRLIRTTFEASSITHLMDENGNRIRSDRDGAAVTRTFDVLDRLVQRTDEFGNQVDYTYDAAGNLVELTYPSDLDGDLERDSVSYEYDSLSRLVKVTDWEGRETTYTYDTSGPVKQATLPDASTVSYVNDLAGQLTGILDSRGATVYFAAAFSYNEAGLRTAANVELPSAPGCQLNLTPGAQTFEYGASVDPSRPSNELLRRDTDSFVYDNDGNLKSGTIGGASRSLVHNALNELTRIDSDTFRYDADGLRVEAIRGGTTRQFVHDATSRSLLEEHDAAGNVVGRYVYGLGLISRQDDQGEYRVYHYDSRGSTVVLTDVLGTITDCYAYDPFGQRLAQTGSTDNPFRYNGRDGVIDDDNGLYFMRARYYAPELMRFIQKDQVVAGSLRDTQSLNRYAFVQGNPIQLVDPNGDAVLATLAVIGVATLVSTVVAIAAACSGEGCREKDDGTLDWAVIAGAGVEGAIGGSLAAIIALVPIPGSSVIGEVFGNAVGAAYGGLVRNAIARLGEGSGEDAIGQRIGSAALAGGLGAGLGKVGAKVVGKSGISKRIAGSKLGKARSSAIRKFRTVKLRRGNQVHVRFPEEELADSVQKKLTKPFKGSGEKLGGIVGDLIGDLIRAARPGFRTPGVPGTDTSGTTATDRLNPLATPAQGPQPTTGCGCACEVWR